MTGAGMIDALIKYALDIGQATANDAAFRERLLFHVQQTVDEIWPFRPWPWKTTQGIPITVPPAGFVNLPVDFGGPGYILDVNNTDGKYKLEWMSPPRLFDLRERETGTESRPKWYTIADQDQTTGIQQIHVHKKPIANVVLRLAYETQSPQITDSAAPSGLELIPVHYHSSIVFEGAKARLQEDEGDGRYPATRAAFRRRLMEMWAQEKQTTHTPRRSPRYAAAMLGRRLWR